MNPTISKFLSLAILMCLSIIILMQDPFAPFANKTASYDPGVFTYSAKEMIRGGLIYKDFFDHKGPVLYLLNVIGLILLGGDLTGIWLVDLVCLATATFFLYKSAELFASKFVALLAVVYTLFLSAVLEPGNGTQFFALPFICISLFLFLKSFVEEGDFKKIDLMVVAGSFALTFLLQPYLVTLWCAFGAVTITLRLYEKNYRYLLRNFLVIIAVIAITLIPFLIYALDHQLLSDAISCFWTFNRAYSHPSFGTVAEGAYYTLINIEKGHAVIPVAFYLGYLALHFKEIDNKRVHAGIVLSLFLTLFIGCSLSGLNYPHYSIILLPLICVIVVFCLEYLRQRHSVTNSLLLFIFAIFSWRLVAIQICNTHNAYKPDERLNALVKFIQKNTDKNDRIAIVGNDSQLYYLADRKSSSRFHYTSPIFAVTGFNIDIAKQYLDDLHRNSPKLIAVKTVDYLQQPAFINKFLSDGYKPAIPA